MKSKIKILRLLTSCLVLLSVAPGRLWADRAADLLNEMIPPGATMHPPFEKYTGVVPATSGLPGYTPQQLRHAYGLDQLNTTGQGQTIAIVDACGSPTVQADLNTFCAAFGLPSTAVRIYFPQGQPVADSDWATETSLDVEWAHAIAPGATIVLVVAQSATSDDLFGAVDYAVSLGATQVSMSWCAPEYSTESSSDFHFNVPGVTFVASSGDSGAGVNYPACSPYVVGVGGTTLKLTSSNTIASEKAWSGSGGGASLYETGPSYQVGWRSGAQRAVPDVAYDADPATGVPVYLTGSDWQQIGGTSMGAPQWAALFALANSLSSQPIGSAPGVLYTLATANYTGYFHDITSGNSGNPAGPGYDLATGLGTPFGNQLVVALAGGFSSQASAPVFFPPAGAYASAQNVTIVSATPGVSLHYTTDGSTPSKTKGALYAGPIPVSANLTLKAVAYGSGLANSAVTAASYTFLPQAIAPVFSPAAGTYHLAQTVAISTKTSGASIRYTTDGSIPTEIYGTLYSGPVSIGGTATVNAVAYRSGYIDSPVSSGPYTITPLNVMCNFPTTATGGYAPYAGLVQGSDGNFYGTTQQGGSSDDGAVFVMTPAGVVTTLVSFTGANGAQPMAALVQGSDGNFYGTTEGGQINDGTVFKMTPAGALTTLVKFIGANGANPYPALFQGTDGNFYGTTLYGGSKGDGTVFKVTPAGALTVLVSFNGTNGACPYAELVQGSDGNFYGTTSSGGASGNGTVFKLTPAGALTTLVSFAGTPENWPDGASPSGGLVLGSDGNFYGTTQAGGSGNSGTVFRMTPSGALTVVASFDEDGDDGSIVLAGLVQGRDGNFYGTALSGGSATDGTVFKVTPAGVITSDSFNGANGDGPAGRLIIGRDGNLYGTTVFGGTDGYGVVFQVIVPSQAAAPTFSPGTGTYTKAQKVAIAT
ncbi:MAG: choice-of-anchor tandem repeat GloVer-containing protein, partial [Opitutaceae bacterium]